MVLDVAHVLLSEQFQNRLQLSPYWVRKEGIILHQRHDLLGPLHQTEQTIFVFNSFITGKFSNLSAIKLPYVDMTVLSNVFEFESARTQL